MARAVFSRLKRAGRLPELICSVMLCASSRADVIVIQNVSPGATNWPGSPIISTLANPSSQTTVGESFDSANTSIGQTFTVTTTNYKLQTIDLYVGGGTGLGAGRSPVPGQPAVVGEQFVLTNTTADAAEVFRLSKP